MSKARKVRAHFWSALLHQTYILVLVDGKPVRDHIHVATQVTLVSCGGRYIETLNMQTLIFSVPHNEQCLV